ncbi:MAG: hypothetical protein ACXABG_10430 [Promethearchaeota archaeon]|jgi:hypothetical protein
MNPNKTQSIIKDETENLETEKINDSKWLEMRTSLLSPLSISFIAIFTALTIVLGYLLAYIPNLEVFTMMIFLSGFIMSKKEGAIIGFLSSSIFTFFNPLGPSPPPLFAYQLIHYSVTGILGGITKDFLRNKEYFKPMEDLYVFRILLLFGFLGAIITFIFDILSTLFGGFVVSVTIDYFVATYLLGIVFTTVHLIGNVLIFIFLLPGLIQITVKIID